MPINPIKNKPIAQQRQIAERQRYEEELRKQNLAKTIESKKKLVKTQAELFKEKQLRDAQAQSELVKKAYYEKVREENEKKE